MVNRTQTVHFGANFQEARISTGSKGKGNEKETTRMARTYIAAADLPVQTRGRNVETTPKVTIADNAQVRLNGKAAPALNGYVHAAVSFDIATRALYLEGIDLAKPPKGFSKDKSLVVKISTSEKSKQVSFAGSSLFKYLKYDYKASGNQTFDCNVDEKTHIIVFTIPEGSLTPKPKQTRTPKAPVAPVAPTAPTPATDED